MLADSECLFLLANQPLKCRLRFLDIQVCFSTLHFVLFMVKRIDSGIILGLG